MNKWLIIITLALLITTGCSTKKDLTYSKMNINKVKPEVKSFIQEIEDQNGIYLYFEENKAVYVFLNGINVIQGDKAIYYDDFKLRSDGDILKIVYCQKETDDYSNDELGYQLLYKVNLEKHYNVIKAIQNGQEVSIDSVSGE